MKDFNKFIKTELDELKRNNRMWPRKILETASVPRAVVNGKKTLILCSNNYLGLTNHPKLKNAAINAIKKFGVGSGSVRIIAGNMTLHEELDRKIAEYKKTEAAIHFPTGFAANAGTIPQLVGKEDVIISDELNHGSIIDGVRLSNADKMVFKHTDINDLAKVLEEIKSKEYKRKLIISDGVFSMDGDIAPLPGIVKEAEKHDATIYIDDAHGEGVLGKNGRGLASHFNLEGKVDIEVGTFSKAFGNMGGYVSGSKDLAEYIYNKARTFLLSASIPPATLASCIAALEVIDEEPQIIQNLWSNVKYFKNGLNEMGFDIGKSVTPITPIMLNESDVAQHFSEELMREGILALPIIYPLVARDKARIRTIISAVHTMEDLDFALESFEKVGKKLGVIHNK